MQRSALCRSRRELSNAYLLAKIGVDTAENEPLEVWGENSIQYSLHSLLAPRAASGRRGESTATPEIWRSWDSSNARSKIRVSGGGKLILSIERPRGKDHSFEKELEEIKLTG